MPARSTRHGLVAVVAVVALAAAVRLGSTPASAAERLVGTFRLTAGSCAGGNATGSYFRMILPSGGRSGPFVSNNDSACSDKSYTLLAPGSDGGLVVSAYQPEPSPAFDGSGNSRARRITVPTMFYGVGFSASTNAKDPQTKASVPPPTLSVASSGALSGDLRSFAASWNNQEFNQGAPKPDGSTPGQTALPSGHYDRTTGAFSLEWASQIVGGPFDKFTGLWHLQGTFVPANGSAAAAPSPGPSTGGSATSGRASGSNGATAAPTATASADATRSAGPRPSGSAQPSAGASSGAVTAAGSAGPAPDRASSAAPALAAASSHSGNRGWLVAVAALVIAGTGFGVVRRVRRRGGVAG